MWWTLMTIASVAMASAILVLPAPVLFIIDVVLDRSEANVVRQSVKTRTQQVDGTQDG